MSRSVTVAVTGLSATDNPAPGVGVIRALRADPDLDLHVVGLAYDALEPGLYAEGLVDDAFLIPWPSQGPEALEARLRYIHEQVPLDAVLPTLDSELPGFLALAPVLEELGIGAFLPTAEQLDLRSKAHLTNLAQEADLPVPDSRVVADPNALYTIHEEIPYPLWVKGAFYGATRARGPDEAIAAWHEVVAKWGVPVIVQADVSGDEVDVCAVGDGRGGLLGAVAMKKTLRTDLGKGWAGLTIGDHEALEVTARFVSATNWRGPCEVELVRDADGHPHLLEINPRFPAWVYVTAAAGQNLPAAALRLALGERLDPLPPYRVGAMFVRISLDQVTDLSTFQALVTDGERLRGAP